MVIIIFESNNDSLVISNSRSILAAAMINDKLIKSILAGKLSSHKNCQNYIINYFSK